MAVKSLYSDEIRQEVEHCPRGNEEDILQNQDLLPYMLAELAENLLSTKLLGSAFVKISTTVRNNNGSLVSKLAYVGYDSVSDSKITYNPTADVKASTLAAWVSESGQSLTAIRPTNRFGILKNEAGMPLFPPVDIKAITPGKMEGLLTEFLAAIWDYSVSAINPKPPLDISSIEDRPSDFIDVERFPFAECLSYAGHHFKTYSLIESFVRCAVTNEHFHFRSGSEIQAASERAAAQITEQNAAGAPVALVEAQHQSAVDATTTSHSTQNSATDDEPNPRGTRSPDPRLVDRLDAKFPEPQAISGAGSDVEPTPKPLGPQVPNQFDTTTTTTTTTRARKRKSVPEFVQTPDGDENTAPPAKRQRPVRAAAAAPCYVPPKAALAIFKEYRPYFIVVYRTTHCTSRRHTPIGSSRASRTPTGPRFISQTNGNGEGHTASLDNVDGSTPPPERASEGPATAIQDGSDHEGLALAAGHVASTGPLRHNGSLDPESLVLVALKRTIERQNHQLRSKTKALERIKEELSSARQQYSESEDELAQRDEEIVSLRKNERQYQNWWLNEIQFTKLLLNKFPEPNRDIELVRASQAHYLGHY
ncbi:hypothetical protein BKA70DRAFT_1439274 [Coprinopsis sp. MPI-PUGE-AT-0042]|nr:hypothetical protein BKA70DRAFT_1439274 [Coprinopsis sp. MPI-PUGE-AT-0042]